MKNNCIFYIDPQSRGTLAQYDRCLLDGIVSSAPADISIMYFCNRFDNPYKYQKPIEDHRIFDYNKVSGNTLRGISYLSSYLRILSLAIKHRPKIIHIQWIKIPRLDYVFLKIFQSLGCTVTFTAHNLLPHDDNDPATRIRYLRYYQAVDRIIVHSPTTKAELANDFNIDQNKIFVIPHGLLPLDVSESEIQAELSKIRNEMNPDGKTIYTSLGAKYAYKGTDLIIKSWIHSPSLNRNPDVILVIAGMPNGLDYSELSKYPNVIIEDEFLSNARYIAYLRLSSATLFPYKTISQSGSLLTALSERTPVIISHVGGLPDVLDIADVGWDLGKPTVENLSSTLTELMKTPWIFREKKDNGTEWNRIEEALSWNIIGRQTLGVYGI